MCRSFVVRAETRELLAIIRAFRAVAAKLVRIACELVIETLSGLAGAIAARVLGGAGNAGRGWC